MKTDASEPSSDTCVCSAPVARQRASSWLQRFVIATKSRKKGQFARPESSSAGASMWRRALRASAEAGAKAPGGCIDKLNENGAALATAVKGVGEDEKARPATGLLDVEAENEKLPAEARPLSEPNKKADALAAVD